VSPVAISRASNRGTGGAPARRGGIGAIPVRIAPMSAAIAARGPRTLAESVMTDDSRQTGLGAQHSLTGDASKMDAATTAEKSIRPTRNLAHALVSWALRCTAVVVLVLAVMLINNNYSFRRIARSEFRARLDRSIESSTAWLSARPEVFGNPPIMFMVVDMEKMSGDARLRRLLVAYRHSRFVVDSAFPLGRVWARMVDPSAKVPLIDATQVPADDVAEILWDAYAIAPDRVLISSAQRASMFSPTRYFWGRRQHQLLALDIYRYYNGGSIELDATLNHLAEKVARDAHFDFRVNDSYPQRSAFVLSAGRPDLIRARWIERVLNYQHLDGSWSYCWYRWCKGLFEFRARDVDPLHTTVQAAWALHMLKYRYPQWIDQHYR
jgi:hypothetical protein